MTIPVGGINDNPTLTLSGFAPFVYDPTQGDLLLEVIVVNQDIVPNFSGNGYNEADYEGTDTTRAFCVSGFTCHSGDIGALVTTFATTPEPSSLLLLGSGVLGLAGMGRRKLMQ